jgi:signal transduction histidine kinase
VGAATSWRAPGPGGQRLLVWAGGFSKDGNAFSLAVAEDTGDIDRALLRFEWVLGGLAAGVFLLMMLLQRFLVHRAFLELAPVYRDIARLEQGETGTLTEDVPTEILPLVRKLNRLLDLLGRRLERSRNAVGNLAHALKSPLSLMLYELHQASHNLDPELQHTLEEQLARVQTLMERELQRARLAGGGGGGELFDARVELPLLGRLLQQMYAEKELDIDCRIHSAKPLPADRQDMLELLGNLLDNACKWARAKVVCTVAQQAGYSLLQVEDDGPGCAPEELSAISDRGMRLDESVTGYGLGLAIARDIVDTYGGQLIFGRSLTLGGFSAKVVLPQEGTIPSRRQPG